MTVVAGASRLVLPVREPPSAGDRELPPFGPPEGAPPLDVEGSRPATTVARRSPATSRRERSSSSTSYGGGERRLPDGIVLDDAYGRRSRSWRALRSRPGSRPITRSSWAGAPDRRRSRGAQRDVGGRRALLHAQRGRRLRRLPSGSSRGAGTRASPATTCRGGSMTRPSRSGGWTRSVQWSGGKPMRARRAPAARLRGRHRTGRGRPPPADGLERRARPRSWRVVRCVAPDGEGSGGRDPRVSCAGPRTTSCS